MRALPLLLLLAACSGDDEAVDTDRAPVPPEPAPEAHAPSNVHTFVGTPTTLDAGSSQGDLLTWTLGDGTQAQGAVVEHTWTAPGHYTVFLEAEGADGRVDSDSLVVTVTWEPAATAPRSSSTLASTGDRLLAVLDDHDLLAVVELHTRTPELWLDTCSSPRTVSAYDGSWAVACTDDRVDVFDPADASLRGHVDLPWGSRPFGVVVTGPDEAWVTLQGSGQLARLSLDPPALVELVDVEPDVRGLAWTGEHLLVTRHRSPDDGGVLLRYAPATGQLERFTVPIDPGPDSDTNARGVPSYLQHIAVRPDGRVAALPGLKANLQRGLVRDGLPLTHETTVRADLRTMPLTDAEAPLGTQVGAALFDDRDLALAAVYSPLGDWLFVAQQGMETVDILDSATLQRAGAIQDVGHRPDGLWVSPDASELWVFAALSRQLTSYDLSNLGAPARVEHIDLQPPTGEALPADVYAGKVIFGRSVDPRMSTGGYVSCASCHLDGDSDHRVWDFTDRAEGLRNTISLRGHGGTDHGPIHWSANFDEVQDFEHDIRGPQQGQGFLDDADFEATSDTLGAPKAGLDPDLDALAAYVSSLTDGPHSPYREASGDLTAEALLGQQLFASPQLGCVTCHPPPTYTDSQWLAPGVPLLHDVGTLTPDSGQRLGGPLDGIDTPTLLGLHDTAPYLHDGSAATLREVLVDRNPDDAHGTTSILGEPELDALTAFLLQLE
jgi:mono/diheme cytochrome c family protein